MRGSKGALIWAKHDPPPPAAHITTLKITSILKNIKAGFPLSTHSKRSREHSGLVPLKCILQSAKKADRQFCVSLKRSQDSKETEFRTYLSLWSSYTSPNRYEPTETENDLSGPTALWQEAHSGSFCNTILSATGAKGNPTLDGKNTGTGIRKTQGS